MEGRVWRRSKAWCVAAAQHVLAVRDVGRRVFGALC